MNLGSCKVNDELAKALSSSNQILLNAKGQLESALTLVEKAEKQLISHDQRLAALASNLAKSKDFIEKSDKERGQTVASLQNSLENLEQKYKDFFDAIAQQIPIDKEVFATIIDPLASRISDLARVNALKPEYFDNRGEAQENFESKAMPDSEIIVCSDNVSAEREYASTILSNWRKNVTYRYLVSASMRSILEQELAKIAAKDRTCTPRFEIHEVPEELHSLSINNCVLVADCENIDVPVVLKTFSVRDQDGQSRIYIFRLGGDDEKWARVNLLNLVERIKNKS